MVWGLSAPVAESGSPIDGVHTAITRLQDGVLKVRPESHLGGFAVTEEVLAHMSAKLSGGTGACDLPELRSS